MHGAGTQAGSTVSHIGIQCELLLPPVVSTSTPTKANVAVPASNISDVSDTDDDDNNIADITQSSVYLQTTSASEPESDMPVEKQRTYLLFESALLMLFSICFMCRNTYTSIEKTTIGSFLHMKQICHHCSNKYVCMGKSALCRENPSRQYYDFSCYTLHGIITSKGIMSIPKLELCDNHKEDIFWHQKSYLQPAVSYIWEKEQETLINQLTDKKEALVLGGDGRADSPGHSAKYGSYSVIDLKQSKVADIKLVQV